MEWSKLKNIILLLLVCVNAFLLLLVGMWEGSGARYQEETRKSAVATLQRSGIAVNLEHLPREMALQPLLVNRDQAAELETVRALLGQVEQTGGSELRPRYSGLNGSAEYSADGELSVQFATGAWFRQEGQSYEKASEECLERIGFHGELIEQEQADGQVRLTYCQQWKGTPVFSCTLTLTWSGEELRSIEGQRLSGTAEETAGETPLAVSTALIRFLAGINEGGYVCSRIDSMTAGYRLSSSVRPARLDPVWRLSTDSGDYYVDAATGTLSLAG